MATKLTDKRADELADKLAAELPAPASADKRGYILYPDAKIKGLSAEIKGLSTRVTKAGARSRVLTYRTKKGGGHRLTIGDLAHWPRHLVREKVALLSRIIDEGGNPMAERQALRSAPTVADLIDRWRREIAPKLSGRSRKDVESMFAQHILPAFGRMKVADVESEDIERLHRKISQHRVRGRLTETRANRVAAMLSRLFNLSIRWKMRVDNPVKGLEKNDEQPRRRYLKPAELARLVPVLDGWPNQDPADVVRLGLMTGDRSGEILNARWEQYDLDNQTRTKPGSTVKQKIEHHQPLSDEAVRILRARRAAAEAIAAKYGREVSPWVFSRKYGGKPLSDIRHAWTAILRAADISDLHFHDLRHSFASFLVSSGHSLPMIGSLLGHSQTQTTNRYAHLLIEAQRDAANEIGVLMSTAKSGKVVPLTTRERRRTS